MVIKRIGRGHDMAVQAAAQGNRRSLVKQDPPAGARFEHRTSLLLRDFGEKINKLSQGDSVFQVLKQSRNLDPGAAEHPGTTDPPRIPLHGGASSPAECGLRAHGPCLESGASPQFRRPLHHLRMQGHHAAVGEEAAERQQADLISRAQWAHQAFHPHQIADHSVGIGITLELPQGVAPQMLSPIEGDDQHTRIEVEPHASPPGGPLKLQCGIDLFLAETFNRGDGSLKVQQLGEQPAGLSERPHPPG